MVSTGMVSTSISCSSTISAGISEPSVAMYRVSPEAMAGRGGGGERELRGRRGGSGPLPSADGGARAPLASPPSSPPPPPPSTQTPAPRSQREGGSQPPNPGYAPSRDFRCCRRDGPQPREAAAAGTRPPAARRPIAPPAAPTAHPGERSSLRGRAVPQRTASIYHRRPIKERCERGAAPPGAEQPIAPPRCHPPPPPPAAARPSPPSSSFPALKHRPGPAAPSSPPPGAGPALAARRCRRRADGFAPRGAGRWRASGPAVNGRRGRTGRQLERGAGRLPVRGGGGGRGAPRWTLPVAGPPHGAAGPEAEGAPRLKHRPGAPAASRAFPGRPGELAPRRLAEQPARGPALPCPAAEGGRRVPAAGRAGAGPRRSVGLGQRGRRRSLGRPSGRNGLFAYYSRTGIFSLSSLGVFRVLFLALVCLGVLWGRGRQHCV